MLCSRTKPSFHFFFLSFLLLFFSLLPSTKLENTIGRFKAEQDFIRLLHAHARARERESCSIIMGSNSLSLFNNRFSFFFSSLNFLVLFIAKGYVGFQVSLHSQRFPLRATDLKTFRSESLGSSFLNNSIGSAGWVYSGRCSSDFPFRAYKCILIARCGNCVLIS